MLYLEELHDDEIPSPERKTMPKTVHFSTQAQKRSFTAKKTTQNPGNKKNSKGIIKLIRKKPEWDVREWSIHI